MEGLLFIQANNKDYKRRKERHADGGEAVIHLHTSDCSCELDCCV